MDLFAKRPAAALAGDVGSRAGRNAAKGLGLEGDKVTDEFSRRAGAAVIDCVLAMVIASAVVFIVFLSIVYFFGEAYFHDLWSYPGGQTALLLTLCGALVVYIAYYTILEAMFGATIGKRLMRLTVVLTDGRPIGWKESIIRNVLRIVDMQLFGLVGLLFVWATGRSQRIGDLASSTIVVSREFW